MTVSRLLVLSLALSPAMLMGQKKEELTSIQRDIADMDDHVKRLTKAFDDKIAALTALVQQSLDASAKTNAQMAALQKDLEQKLADQQTKLVTPVATLSTKVDEMSGDFSAVRENVKELVRHMNDLDGKIADISSAIRTLNSTPVAPPPGNVAAAGTAAQVPTGPPAGWSAELAYNTAFKDYQAKADDKAMDELAQYVKFAPQSENAPNAQFYIAQIYYRGEQWDDAVQAFDAVMEKYPPNAKTQEAQYMKACALMKAKKNTAAATEFKNFIAKYPESSRAKDAHVHLRELGMDSSARKRPY